MKITTTKHTLLHGTLLFGTLSCLVGCPEDEKPSTNHAPSLDMRMPDDMAKEDMASDMTSDMTGDDGTMMPDMNTDMEEMACVPKTSCEPDACGRQEDGCGGMLDCGACHCVEGQPVEPSCGVCDLGVTRCEEGVTSKNAVSCDYPGGEEALGMVKSCASVKYVNLDAPAGGDGTKAAPFKTYAEALATFRSEEEGAILLTTGFYQEPLVVRSGIHVLGGFQAEGWVADPRPQRMTVFNAPVVQEGPTIGMIAHDVSEFTLVYSVLAQALDTAPGQNSYGAHLQDSPGLVVESSRITAGRAGDGANGVDGADGADGGDGLPPTCMLVDIGQSASFGGAGGVNLSCPEANGGQGGAGAYYTSALGRVAATDGAPSADGTVAGGAAGLTGNTQGNATASNGLNALRPAQEGSEGAGGKAGGMLVEGYWVSTGQGADGEEGPHGAGGGGGGGAGSNLQRPQEIGGGGGAAGGCGGEGGTGGGAGGVSIGLIALNSNATFRNTQIWGGSGGRGGRGGRGGGGGFPGSSASGSWTDCTGVLRNWKSGNGGAGALGRSGGPGGGGAGGNSYGAYCVESTLTVDNMAIRAGRGGSGGTGGVPTNEGEDGLSIVHVDCIEEATP